MKKPLEILVIFLFWDSIILIVIKTHTIIWTPQWEYYRRAHIQFSSVTQSCPTLCNPMDCSTPRFPLHNQVPKLAQTHVHWVSKAIQPSHLLSPSPPAFTLSQHQGLFQWVSSCIRWPKYWRFSYSISPSNEYSGLISLGLFCWFCRIVLLFCLV